jgi:DHA2 family multidrug resistance protein
MALGSFLVPLLLAISFARYDDTAASTLLLLGLGALMGGLLFVLQELVTPTPAVNLRLFRIPTFSLVCCTAFLDTLGLFGAQFMMPIFLQQVMGFTAFQAGLIIVPAIIVSGMTGVITGRLTDLVSPPLLALCALLMLTTVFYSLSTVTVLTTVGTLVGYIIIYRTCMFAAFTPLTALNVQTLEAGQVRMGQGLLGVVRNIGGSLGVTITSVFFERRRAAHQLLTYDAYAVGTPEHGAMMQTLKQTLHDAGVVGATADQTALGAIRREMDIEAIAGGFRESFLLLALFFILGCMPLVCLLVLRQMERRRSGNGPKPDASRAL